MKKDNAVCAANVLAENWEKLTDAFCDAMASVKAGLPGKVGTQRTGPVYVLLNCEDGVRFEVGLHGSVTLLSAAEAAKLAQLLVLRLGSY